MDTSWSRPTKYIAGVGLVLLAIFILYISRSIIPLLILAALIAVLVRPVILWLHNRLNLPRGLAVGLVYLLVIILIPLAILLAVPAIIDAVNFVVGLDYQAIQQDVVEWARATLLSIQEANLPLPALDDYVDQMAGALLVQIQPAEPSAAPVLPPLETILQSLGSALTATFGAAAGLVGAVASQIALVIFMLLASIHMSLGAHTYRSGLLRAAPEAYRPEFAILLARIETLWNAFFRGQLSLMILIGVLSWLGLMILGVPGALYLGIVAGLLEIIPNLGPVIATIPAVIVALLQGSSNFQLSPLVVAGLVILFYVLLQQLENNIIVPRILGDAVELPALVVMAGVLVGASVGGILGALLATPVIATGREIIQYIYRKMQGQDPFPPRQVELDTAESVPFDLREKLRSLAQRVGLVRKPEGPTPPQADSDTKTESGAETFPPNP